MVFDLASALLGGVILLLVTLSFRDYGITWDETWHLNYGRHVIHWFVSGFTDDEALWYRADYLYGGAFDGLGYLVRQISPLDRYETIHLFGALVGCLGLLGTWKLGRLLGGPAAGFLSLLLLVLTPVWWGHMFANPKDIPFAVGYVWSLYYLIRIFITVPSVPPREWVKASVTLGLAMSVRIAGLLTICYLVMLLGLWILWRARQERDARVIPRYILRFLPPLSLAAIGAWALMLVLWPWAQLAPLRRPLIVLARMSSFNLHERSMPFGDRRISSLSPPPDYLLRYFGFKLPELVIVLVLGALVVFIVRLVRLRRRAKADLRDLEVPVFEGLRGRAKRKARRKARRTVGRAAAEARELDLPLARERRLLAIWGFLAFTILFPVLYAIVKRSPLYDGLRHFLFLIPLFTVIAGVTFVTLTRMVARRTRALAWGLQVLVLAHSLRMVVAMVGLHPLQYVWFNAFIGELPGAYLRYSTDYYGASYKEAYESLRRHLWETERERFLAAPYIVSACMPEFVAKEYFSANFEWRKRGGGLPAEFWLGYTRNNCYLQKEEHPEIIRVERDGVLLNLARDLRDPEDRGVVPVTKPKPPKAPKVPKSKPRKTPIPRGTGDEGEDEVGEDTRGYQNEDDSEDDREDDREEDDREDDEGAEIPDPTTPPVGWRKRGDKP